MRIEQYDGLKWLTQINKASLVALVEAGIVERSTAGSIGQAIEEIAARHGDGRASLVDYLAYEKELTALCGESASTLHIGRSRIDINRTRFRLTQRVELLRFAEALNVVRGAILALARDGRHDIVPTYTLGVQAQPTSFGHYLSAFAEAFARDVARTRTVFLSLNQCPLGAAAGITSTFPINRARLAQLLGFDSPIENAFDAVHISPLDSGLDLVHLARSNALLIDLFLSDHAAQYRSGKVWLVIGEDVGISSLMPHKRNPDPINLLRRASGELLGSCSTYELLCHNVTPGITDFAGPHPANVLDQAVRVIEKLDAMLRSVRFDASVALDVVRSAGGSSTELMNVLIRKGSMPPREAHDLVSNLIEKFQGDAHKFHSESFEAAREQFGDDNSFPLTAEEYNAALDPASIVHSAMGYGGSQPAEVDRMLQQAAETLLVDQTWVKQRLMALSNAQSELDRRFQHPSQS